MIELPEAIVWSRALTQLLAGKTIATAVAGHSPHKFAWFSGDPEHYAQRLAAVRVADTLAVGGFVRVRSDGAQLVFGEGVALRYWAAGAVRPVKHQLLVEFTDGTALSAAIQMYGGIWLTAAVGAGSGVPAVNDYYQHAVTTPGPFADEFDFDYFRSLPQRGFRPPTAVASSRRARLSVKALLATEQRIPGFGNGCLQDVLLNAGIHPRRSVDDLSRSEWRNLYAALRTTLAAMVEAGGRDSERDVHGTPGGYRCLACNATVGKPCPRCGGPIVKDSFLGGSVYVCDRCQVRTAPTSAPLP